MKLKYFILFYLLSLPLLVKAQTSIIIRVGTTDGDHRFGYVEHGDTIWDDVAYEKIAKESFKVHDFCNIPFGTSYEEAEDMLMKKFGRPNYRYTDRQGIYYSDVVYAGKRFDTIYFMFQSDGKNSYMNGGIYILKAKGKKDAIKKMEYFNELMNDRYVTVKTKIGKYDGYIGGQDPVSEESKYGFYIDMIKADYQNPYSLQNDYFVRLCYGPYDFIDEGF